MIIVLITAINSNNPIKPKNIYKTIILTSYILFFLNKINAYKIVIIAKTNIRIETLLIKSSGINIPKIITTINGAIIILKLPLIYLYPKAPNKADTTQLNAGANTSLCKSGVKGISITTPNDRITTVVIEEKATEIVATTSFSGVFILVLQFSAEFITQRTFRFIKYNIIKN